MASALISNSLHISFDSVLGMDDAGLVAFFENSSIRDGMVVSTIRGMTVEISENVFAGAFQLPMDGLTDLFEVPKDLVFDAMSIVSDTCEQVSTSSGQLVVTANDTDEDIETIDARTGVGDPQLQIFDAADNRTDASAVYTVTEPVEEMEMAAVEQSADEAMSLEEILMTIPVDCPLPSAEGEVTKIQLGKSISIPGVHEGDWYKASLPKIPATDKGKGKAPLMERDPIKGNPIKEQLSLILADIEQSGRQRFQPRGHQFKKKSGSGSSGSGSSSSSGSRAEFYGFCGGKHLSTQCVGVQGSCNICGQYGHFARVCPSVGSHQAAALPQGQGGSSRGRSPQFP
ncbi:hypothetical protein F511_39008 [Dorcoceras hygrometricum]|uniref:CCHC-type domain-containing protein n=1 Tax=Dorcoceras hygrometricum TaxID=472368 RepID=A0A2Z7BNA3_9LAMI|nr:hypothetical protein F511_39008 [Dorcoceras hygrometricum]